jgi:hypothetical protein
MKFVFTTFLALAIGATTLPILTLMTTPAEALSCTDLLKKGPGYCRKRCSRSRGSMASGSFACEDHCRQRIADCKAGRKK